MKQFPVSNREEAKFDNFIWKNGNIIITRYSKNNKEKEINGKIMQYNFKRTQS